MFKKIAFIGTTGSGKSSMISSLGGLLPLTTNMKSRVNLGHGMATVAIDFGQIAIDEQTQLGLYGIPGQKKFSQVWDFIKQELWAAVILIKNNDPESIEDLQAVIDYFLVKEKIPCIIGVTHTDQGDHRDTFSAIRSCLKMQNLNIPVFSTDARCSESGLLLLETIVAMQMSQIHYAA